MDLFPETISAGPAAALVRRRFQSTKLTKEGYPLVVLELIAQWFNNGGWKIGWLVWVDKASVDEWMPGTSTPDAWPWYRPDTQPQSAKFALAAGIAARAAKIVLAQILTYTVDPAALDAGREVTDMAEAQAMRWLVGEDHS